MKGGVTCLGSMFRRKTKTNSKETQITSKAIIVQMERNVANLPSTTVKPEVVSVSILLVDEIHDGGHADMEVDMSDPRAAIQLAFENGIGDIEYEGEDEKEDASGRTRPPETDSDRPLSDFVHEFSFNTECPTCEEVLDNNSMCYENSVQETCEGSTVEQQSSVTDLEMGSGHVSDPGGYRTKSLCSSSPLPSHGQCANEEKEKNNQEQIHLGDSSCSEDPCHLNSMSVTLRSYGSSSSGGELRSEIEFEDSAYDGRFKLGASGHAVEAARGTTGMSRVEEWVSNLYPVPLSLDDEDEIEEAPESPVRSHMAPTSPFFEASDQEKTQALGGDVDPDLEMAKLAVRSVNRLSTVAQISGVGLKVVPCLGMFTSLKTLNLSANCIVRITPGCLPRNLHVLDVSRNQIVSIEGLRELTRLRVLNLSFNRISRIGNGLSSCTSLKEIHLVGNKISEVEGLHRLSKLVFLDLSLNKFSTSKSLGQIAANYKSLQVLNLLGNAVASQLGEDQIRRFVTGICPQMMYLNKQPLRAISTREAVVDNLARAAMSKEPKKNSSKALKRANGHQSVTSHRRSGGGSVQGEGQHRKAHRHNHYKVSLSPELPKGFVLLPPSANIPDAGIEGGSVSRQSSSKISAIKRVRSAGVIFRGDNHWSAMTSHQGAVQAH